MEKTSVKKKLSPNDILALGGVWLVINLLMLLDLKNKYRFNEVKDPSFFIVPDYVNSILHCGFVLAFASFAYLLVRAYKLGKSGKAPSKLFESVLFSFILLLPAYPVFLMVMDITSINFKSEQLILESGQEYKGKYASDFELIKGCIADDGLTNKECVKPHISKFQTLRMVTIQIDKLALNSSDIKCKDINPQAVSNHMNAYKQLEAKENEYRDVPFLVNFNNASLSFLRYRLSLTETELAYYKIGCGQL